MPLETELRHFESIKDDLIQHHEGKYALIIGTELIGVFDHPQEAYAVGIRERGNVPMLIKPIRREDPTEQVPALALGLLIDAGL